MVEVNGDEEENGIDENIVEENTENNE